MRSWVRGASVRRVAGHLDFDSVARRLIAGFVEINEDCVDGRLRLPTFAIDDLGTERLGQWCRNRRQITLSLSHVLGEPWSAVLETLRHEMAHQFVDEILGIEDEAPHGPAFVSACERLRADPAARRLNDPGSEQDKEEQSGARRIQKLLALAEGTTSAHEAAAALRKARELMSSDGSNGVGPSPAHGTLELGRVRKRHEAWEYALANLLTDGFGVSIVWVPSFSVSENRDGTAMLVHGRRSQLQTAEHAHAFLTAMIPGAWSAHRRREGLSSSRDRARFAHGFLLGVRDRMFRRPDTETRSGEPATAALVPFAVDAELDRFVRWRHPRMRTVSVGAGRGSDSGFSDGRRAGREVSLYRPLGRGSAAGPGLLGDS